MNRKGLTGKHYLSPLSSEHAIDDYYGDQQQHLDSTKAEEEREEKEEKEEKEGEQKREGEQRKE